MDELKKVRDRLAEMLYALDELVTNRAGVNSTIDRKNISVAGVPIFENALKEPGVGAVFMLTDNESRFTLSETGEMQLFSDKKSYATRWNRFEMAHYIRVGIKSCLERMCEVAGYPVKEFTFAKFVGNVED